MSKTVLTIPHHNLICLVGPTCVGKSTLSGFIQVQAKAKGMRCKIISSDTLRKDLLGLEENDNVRTIAGVEVSDQAFDLLFANIKAHISFPVNTEIVIVDTTGLDHKNRNTIADMCVTHNYSHQTIVLDPDPKVVKESMKANGLEYMIPVYNSHSAHLKDTNFNGVKNVTTIKDFLPNDMNIELDFPNLAMARSVQIKYPCAIIGDTHECVHELISLVYRIRQKDPKIPIYLLGDFIDKGNNTFEMIDFLIENPDIILVIGNHENYVWKAINGKLSNRNLDDEAAHFTSVEMLEHDHEYKIKFNQLHDRCLPFLVIRDPDLNAYFTHSPCKNNQLGKFDSKSLSAQMKQRFNWDKPVIQQLEYLYQEADNKHPLHVFGHVMIDKFNHVIKNKIAIDQGCYLGHKLTCLYIDKVGKHTFLYQPSFQPRKEELLCFPKRDYVVPNGPAIISTNSK